MTMINTDPATIDDLLNRRINEVIPDKDTLRKMLLSGKRIRIYQGFDPTSPNLHIGHLVGILTLKAFQDLGHEVIFLIGDFTATIGDPTGKDKARVPMTHEQVLTNAKTYQEQVNSILNFGGENPAQLKFNGTWLRKMTLEETLQLAMGFTVQQIIERDMFQKRMTEGKPISLHELLYPILVTKDALEMEVDIELGGSDQMFNMSVGRHVIKSLIGKDKLAVTTMLLADSSGRKIGKTEGNAINIAAKPEDLYGQLMSLSDDAIMPCFRLITLIPNNQLDELASQVSANPMVTKKRLAWEVVKMLHNEETANQAQEHFEKTVQAGTLPQDIPTVALSAFNETTVTLEDVLVNLHLVNTNSEGRRLIEQNAVKVDGQVINNRKELITLKPGLVIQAGKRKFVKIV